MEIFRILALLRFPCLFYLWTGWYCPGCGGTRAVKALLAGHPVISFLYHPLILYCVLVGAWFLLCAFLRWKTKNPRYQKYLGNSYVYVGLGIIGINFLVKNLALAVFGFDIFAHLPAI